VFDQQVYVDRRARLLEQVDSGVIVLLGNDDSPMNCLDNAYPFRQDSSFLYFFGLDEPGLVGVLDVDAQKQTVFGDDVTIEDVIWMGPQPSLASKCEGIGISSTCPKNRLGVALKAALGQGRRIHLLPTYRAEHTVRIQQLLGIDNVQGPSAELIRAVVTQRSVKSAEEIEQIQVAIDTTREMQVTAMRMSRPGVYEREVVSAMEAITRTKDVHDMECLGEEYVGYTDTIKRNPAFGWKSLRLARALEPGFVVTVEPGIYFIPELIKRWSAERRCEQYIDYAHLRKYIGFGGARIEDDILVTYNGRRVLSDEIPRTITDVEAECQASKV
jgi:Xaa-Pro aminopeptidase